MTGIAAWIVAVLVFDLPLLMIAILAWRIRSQHRTLRNRIQPYSHIPRR